MGIQQGLTTSDKRTENVEYSSVEQFFRVAFLVFLAHRVFVRDDESFFREPLRAPVIDREISEREMTRDSKGSNSSDNSHMK